MQGSSFLAFLKEVLLILSSMSLGCILGCTLDGAAGLGCGSRCVLIGFREEKSRFGRRFSRLGVQALWCLFGFFDGGMLGCWVRW